MLCRNLRRHGLCAFGLALPVLVWGCKAAPRAVSSDGSLTLAVSSSKKTKILGQSIPQLHALLVQGDLTVEELTRFYLDRIERFNKKGPALHAVISVNSKALETARRLDALPQAEKEKTELLWGIPLLVKDNIETADDLATTAGSSALKAYFPRRDAPLVGNLREKGVVILGKSNMTEWAGMRGGAGWSAVGDQTVNPHQREASPSGSSSGSAVAVAAGLAVAAIGTETIGSIVSPASANGVVGIRPANGLISQKGIVPIAHDLDTAGPLARRVEDAVILLEGMMDPTVLTKYNLKASLRKEGLVGKRIAYVAPHARGYSLDSQKLLEAALHDLTLAGAETVPLKKGVANMLECESDSLVAAALRLYLEHYLQALPPDLPIHSLKELNLYNEQTPVEMVTALSVDFLKEAEDVEKPAQHLRQKLLLCQKGAREWLEQKMNPDIDAIVDLSDSEAVFAGAFYGGSYLSLPMGFLADGAPVGLTIYVRKGQEDVLLSIATGYEAQTNSKHTRLPKNFATE